MNENSRLGKLPPRHIFILNPYTDARFTRCPMCEEKTKLRKFALFVHVDPMSPVVLGKTCRYCPPCDLLIVHKDELEEQLVALFVEHNPDLIGNDYMVMGTVERKVWREGIKHPKPIKEIMENLHDFEEVRTIERRLPGWYPEDED
jgi:thiol-disulfide isomerase/thioredoxin